MEMFICRGSKQIPDLIIILFAFSCLQFCIPLDIISRTQPIKDPETIISNNEEFQLGFFCPVNRTSRYIGVWYTKAPEAVVWVANRDRPLTDSSGVMMVSEGGNLIVLNGDKEIIWSSNLSNSLANSSAKLLDSGNFVLTDNTNGRTIWESFHYPSNSFLQEMRLSDGNANQKVVLKSWRSPSDPSTGKFHAGINAAITIPEFFVWNDNRPYWRSGPWNNQIFIGVQNMTAGFADRLEVSRTKEGVKYVSFTFSDESLISFIFLDHEGTLIQKVSSEGKSEDTWSSIQTACDVYGYCGPFGSCHSKDSPICTCLKGFEPKHAEAWGKGNFSDGCVRRMPLQCDRNDSSTQERKRDVFLKLSTMKVPDFVGWSPVPVENCENQCLKNCSCTAYAVSEGIGCMLWSGNLIDLQKFSTSGADLYIRLAYSELDGRKSMKAVISISVITGLLFTGIVIYIFSIWAVKRTGTKMASMMQPSKKWLSCFPISTAQTTSDQVLDELQLFEFENLDLVTDNFCQTNKLGQGGFGPVYKGRLPDGQEIAVKRLSRTSGQGIEEFMNEVMVISKLQHRNLVKLLGCCIEGDEKMLIYEYMPNKSLGAFVFDAHKRGFLEWSKLFNIIEGIGRGLLYLHRDSRLRIIHRDLKASNILLDEELNPKISDFGMARIFQGREDQANTQRIAGTYGYMAPEYAMLGRFSEKSDVFSFGVLLLEIVCGRRNTSFYNDELSWSLLGYVWKLWNEGDFATLIDLRFSVHDSREEMLRCIHVGLLCVQEFAEDRPTMSMVLSMLTNENAQLLQPKQPAYTQRPTSSEGKDALENREKCSMNDVTITIVEGR